MNKFLTLAILSATVALGAASAEAAQYRHPAPATYGTVVEGRNAADVYAARNASSAIQGQEDLNARSTR